jgi:hypothetical protein
MSKPEQAVRLAARGTIQWPSRTTDSTDGEATVATELTPVSEGIPVSATRPRGAARAASWLLWLSYLALAVVILALSGSHGGIQFGDLALTIAFFAWASVGALLTARLPSNAVGWTLAIVGVSALASRALGVYVEIAASVAPLPWMVLAGWIGSWSWAISLGAAVIILPFVFPEGRLPTGRLGRVMWLMLAIFALGPLAIAFTPGPVAGIPAMDNPFGIAPLRPFLDAALPLVLLLGAVPIVVSATVPVLRFRRAQADERHQLKWFAFSAAALVVALFLNLATDDALSAVVAVAIALVPLAIGVAILRYRLYDIDLIINRTLVWVPLTAMLGGLYAALVSLLQRVFVNMTGDRSDAAIVISTLVLAGTFTPARKVLDGIVDKRFRAAPSSSGPTDHARTAALADDPVLVDRMERIAERVAREVVRSERRAPRANRPQR